MTELETRLLERLSISTQIMRVLLNSGRTLNTFSMASLLRHIQYNSELIREAAGDKTGTDFTE